MKAPSIVVLSGITANNLGDDGALIAMVRDIQQLLPQAVEQLVVFGGAGAGLEAGLGFGGGFLGLAPLAPGDYIVEVSVRRERTHKTVTAFRILP